MNIYKRPLLVRMQNQWNPFHTLTHFLFPKILLVITCFPRLCSASNEQNWYKPEAVNRILYHVITFTWRTARGCPTYKIFPCRRLTDASCKYIRFCPAYMEIVICIRYPYTRHVEVTKDAHNLEKFNYLHKSKNQINTANTIELHSIAGVEGNQFPGTWSPTTYRSR